MNNFNEIIDFVYRTVYNSSAAFVYWRILASVTKYLRLYIFIDSLLSTFIILIINSSIDKIYNFIKIIHLLLINNETTLRDCDYVLY